MPVTPDRHQSALSVQSKVQLHSCCGWSFIFKTTSQPPPSVVTKSCVAQVQVGPGWRALWFLAPWRDPSRALKGMRREKGFHARTPGFRQERQVCDLGKRCQHSFKTLPAFHD